jgi:hypothetical protein
MTGDMPGATGEAFAVVVHSRCCGCMAGPRVAYLGCDVISALHTFQGPHGPDVTCVALHGWSLGRQIHEPVLLFP